MQLQQLLKLFDEKPSQAPLVSDEIWINPVHPVINPCANSADDPSSRSFHESISWHTSHYVEGPKLLFLIGSSCRDAIFAIYPQCKNPIVQIIHSATVSYVTLRAR